MSTERFSHPIRVVSCLPIPNIQSHFQKLTQLKNLTSYTYKSPDIDKPDPFPQHPAPPVTPPAAPAVPSLNANLLNLSTKAPPCFTPLGTLQ